MNNYLLQLLKDVKTIIIPGLGALTLTSEATGEMMFMPYLKYDDGTLANHIAEKEGLDVNEAKNLIAKFVREVMAELDKGGSYDMYQFGKFSKVDGEVAFEQWQSGSAAPKNEQAQEPLTEAAETTETAPEEEPADAAHPVPAPTPEEAAAAAYVAAEITPEPEVNETPVPENHEPPASPEDTIIREEAVIASFAAAEVTPEEHVIPAETPAPPTDEKPAGQPVLVKAEEPVPPKADQPLVKSEAPSPLPPKGQPKKELSPKERLAAADAKKQSKGNGKDGKQEAPKKKKRVWPYILWGFVVLLLGGGTYVAVNFNALKKDFPVLADLAGDNDDHAKGSKENVLPGDTDDEVNEPGDTTEESHQETTAPETVTDEQTTEPVAVPEPAKPAPKPAETSPKPVSKPPTSAGGNASTPIGSPNPAKPYHVIGGSFGSQANARRFARQLIASGHESVIVGEFNGMYRVSLASFATKAEALQAHGQLTSEVPQAWVFKWP